MPGPWPIVLEPLNRLILCDSVSVFRAQRGPDGNSLGIDEPTQPDFRTQGAASVELSESVAELLSHSGPVAAALPGRRPAGLGGLSQARVAA